MNRLEYTDSSLRENESFLIRENNVRLYDGDQKVNRSPNAHFRYVPKNRISDAVRGRRNHRHDAQAHLVSGRCLQRGRRRAVAAPAPGNLGGGGVARYLQFQSVSESGAAAERAECW